jgi:hypothetical protein
VNIASRNKLRVVVRKNGIWLFDGQYHLKSVCKKYQHIVGECNFIEDVKHKRLTDRERVLLDFFCTTREKQLYAYELVRNWKPVDAVAVRLRTGKYYKLKFPQNIEIRCTREAYLLFGDGKSQKSLS